MMDNAQLRTLVFVIFSILMGFTYFNCGAPPATGNLFLNSEKCDVSTKVCSSGTLADVYLQQVFDPLPDMQTGLTLFLQGECDDGGFDRAEIEYTLFSSVGQVLEVASGATACEAGGFVISKTVQSPFASGSAHHLIMRLMVYDEKSNIAVNADRPAVVSVPVLSTAPVN